MDFEKPSPRKVSAILKEILNPSKSSELEVIATWDACSNELNKNTSWVNDKKLPAIYRTLREQVFVGDPIQENQ